MCFSTQAMQRQPGLLVHPASKIDRRQAQIDVEVDLFLTSGLAVSQARVLFGVPDSKLQLVAQPVVRTICSAGCSVSLEAKRT